MDLIRQLMFVDRPQRRATAVLTLAFDPANTGASITLSNANKTASGGAGGLQRANGSKSRSSGIGYFEFSYDAAGSETLWGVGKTLTTVGYPGSDANSVGADSLGSVYYNGSAVTSFSAPSVGDIIGITANPATGAINWYRNNTLAASYTNAALAAALYPIVAFTSGGQDTIKGGPDLTYAPPGGSTTW